MQQFASSEIMALPLPAPPVRHENSEAASLPLSPLAVTPEERRVMQARIRRLRRGSVLTPDALAQSGDTHLPTETIHALLTMLEGPFEERWEERTVAVWALGQAHLTPRQQETVSQALCRLLRRRPLVGRVRVNQNIDPLAVSLFACLAFWVTINGVFHPAHSKVTIGPIGLTACAFAGGLLATQMVKRSVKAAVRIRDNRLRATAVTALGRIGSISGFATLTRVALDTNATVRKAAAPALQACISRFAPSEAVLLESDVVPNLCRLLERAREQLTYDTDRAETLALSVLSALAQIGDGRAASAVRGTINTGWTAPVNHAAKQILPLLLERKQKEADQRILLRSAALPADASQMLRAAPPAPDTDAKHLLHPFTTD